MVLSKVLSFGEGKELRRCQAMVPEINAFEPAMQARSDAELRQLTDTFRKRLADGQTLDDLLPEAFATVREASVRTLGKRHFDVQLVGGVGAARRPHRRDEDRRGQDADLDPARLPQRPHRRGRPHRHRQRLPGQARRRVDGGHPPLPRPGGRGDPGHHAAAGAPARLRRRHHPRHQQRVRLRLPARQHGRVHRGPGPARPRLRHRRRGRLHPGRRGPHPADHLRRHRAGPPLVPAVRPPGATAAPRRPLRGRRGQAHRGHQRGRDRQGGGAAPDREPLRRDQHPAGPPPAERHPGQGALQARRRVHRPRRRGPDRRRVHRAGAGGTALLRGAAPGHRGQGRGPDQGGEPDLRHHHPAELLPDVRQDRRDDGHGQDRGGRVQPHLQAGRGRGPDQQADDPRGPRGRHLQDRAGQVRGPGRRDRRAPRPRPADPGRHRLHREVRAGQPPAGEARDQGRDPQRQAPRA